MDNKVYVVITSMMKTIMDVRTWSDRENAYTFAYNELLSDLDRWEQSEDMQELHGVGFSGKPENLEEDVYILQEYKAFLRMGRSQPVMEALIFETPVEG